MVTDFIELLDADPLIHHYKQDENYFSIEMQYYCFALRFMRSRH